MTYLLRIVALAAFFLAIAGPAVAQDEPDPKVQAAALKSEADRFMDELEFAKALDRYDEAYRLDPKPALLYNRGRALQALARFPEALDQLEKFQREAPAELKARVPALRELIEGVKASITTLSVTANVEGARVLIDGKDVGATPLSRVRVNAGEAAVELLADGYEPQTKNVTLDGGTSQTLDFALVTSSGRGLLTVKANVPGAVASVDDEQLGTIPAQKELEPGEHAVTVSHEDYETFESKVVIRRGQTTALDAQLEPLPAVYEQWWFWTATIGGTVVVAGAIVGAVIASNTARPADEGDIPPGQVPVRGGAPLGGVSVQLWTPPITF